MKYHLKNDISRSEIRKQGKNIIPIGLMKCSNSKNADLPTKKSKESNTLQNYSSVKK